MPVADTAARHETVRAAEMRKVAQVEHEAICLKKACGAAPSVYCNRGSTRPGANNVEVVASADYCVATLTNVAL